MPLPKSPDYALNWPHKRSVQDAKLRRDKYGISSERRARLIDQLELQLEELEAAATEDALAAEQAAAQDKTNTVRAFTRRKPVRKPFPDHLPRERVVVEAPTSCTCCGSDPIVKMGDDTTVPLLARGGTKTARLWTYVRDDQPWGGSAPPAALFKFSRDRQMIHPNKHLAGWQGVLQADAYSATMNSIWLTAHRDLHAARSAGATHDASSSNWPISSATCARTSPRMTSRPSLWRR